MILLPEVRNAIHDTQQHTKCRVGSSHQTAELKRCQTIMFAHLRCSLGTLQGRCRSGAGSVVITITDSCPECEADHLDLQALTFDKVCLVLMLFIMFVLMSLLLAATTRQEFTLVSCMCPNHSQRSIFYFWCSNLPPLLSVHRWGLPEGAKEESKRISQLRPTQLSWEVRFAFNPYPSPYLGLAGRTS